MAIFVAGDAAIDVNDPDVAALGRSAVVAATPNSVSLRYEGWLDEFRGDFFYDASGKLAGGVITSWKQIYNGNLVFEVTGVNVAMADMLRWIEAGEDSSVVRTVFAGDDHITGSQYGDVLSGHAGGDTLFGMGDADTLEGGSGLDYLRGGDGNDSLTGGDGFDDLHGNTGNDTVYGGLGSDWVVGGQGDDLLAANGISGAIDWSDNVVYGNLGNDTMAGSAGIDWIRGGQGNDNISAGDGADLIWGDRGDDTIHGGGGADVFSIFGEAGLDRILDFNFAEGDRLKVEAGYTYSVVEYGNDVVVTLSGGSAQAWLVGVQLSKLPAGWII